MGNKYNAKDDFYNDEMIILADGRYAIDVARENGIDPENMYRRIKRGWDPLKACTTPSRKGNYHWKRKARMKRVIYLAGPMAGLPEKNFPMFNHVVSRLRYRGHRVYSPHEFPSNGAGNTFDMRRAFAMYSNFICLEADMLIMLPGWEQSLGVSAELALAMYCKIDICTWNVDIDDYIPWDGKSPFVPDIKHANTRARYSV